ncbi:MAG: hypothetical protein JRJ35_10845 [Deltaproteobacteria bacterium]|nr:hypothetical protein [Deltaproteobacteria bacterium]MBW2006649.1 hypothetical protein [Deltaproteobacteria bacterium]
MVAQWLSGSHGPSFSSQVKAWKRAVRKMGWAVARAEFERISPLLSLTDEDREAGYTEGACFTALATMGGATRALNRSNCPGESSVG